MTRHNIDTDVVDDDSSDSDINHDDVYDMDDTQGNNDVVPPLSTHQPKLQVQFAPEGEEKILDLKNQVKLGVPEFMCVLM